MQRRCDSAVFDDFAETVLFDKDNELLLLIIFTRNTSFLNLNILHSRNPSFYKIKRIEKALKNKATN